MLKDENIICISSIDWDFIWQGHQEIMSTFAKNGNKVLYIENTGVRVPGVRDINRLIKRILSWFKATKGFRKEAENLYVYSPLLLPFPYSKIAKWINRYFMIMPLKNWLRIVEFNNPIIWTFLPTETALNIIDNLEKKILIYYCIADFNKLVRDPKKVTSTENRLIKKCDLVFAQGKILKEKCRHLSNNVAIFPFGVKLEVFENFKTNGNKVLAEVKKPIIGYIGGIHKHIDLNLIRFISQTHPEWSIVMIGPEQTSIKLLSGLKNIYMLGKQEFSRLPYYINEFNVCIIPYLKSEYTATVYPTKLNEYHILGKPVVSTELPEVENFNKENNDLVYIAKDYPDFVYHIAEALKETDDNKISERVSSAKKNSWTARIAEMSDLIEETVRIKSERRLDWKENFLRLYTVSRRRFIKITTIAAILYTILFYTDFIWFLAQPLKIDQNPQQADCIVVFANGVGESGISGQGYEERVQYCVDLYKKGYAKKIIFSSGRTFIFHEALVMKALAVSLGIQDEDIIMDDKARNTFENVKISKDILERNGWRKILLVSSPYHMRRALLVFSKIAKDIKVISTPIPNSIYYAHPEKDAYGRKIWKRAELGHIKGILHEYLGIIYYWWSRWI